VFVYLENRAVYEIMLNNTAELGRPQVTIWSMRIACWLLKAKHTHHTHTPHTPHTTHHTHHTHTHTHTPHIYTHTHTTHTHHTYTHTHTKHTHTTHTHTHTHTTHTTHTHTHTQYVMLTAFPLQQWIQERASVLRLYVHCKSCYKDEIVMF